MAIEQWGFFSVQRLQWHRTSVYNGHSRGPVTLTPIAEHLAVEMSLPVFTTYVCRGWDLWEHPTFCARVSNQLDHRCGPISFNVNENEESMLLQLSCLSRLLSTSAKSVDLMFKVFVRYPICLLIIFKDGNLNIFNIWRCLQPALSGDKWLIITIYHHEF